MIETTVDNLKTKFENKEINYNSLEIEDLEGEIWQNIPNYEGYYQCSNYGRIKGFKDERVEVGNYIRIIKPYMDKASKFLRFTVLKNRKSKQIILHTLVAKLFLKNLNNLMFVRHKDENRFNNQISNLEWCGRKIEDFNDIKGEIWKDIPNYEGLYKISNFGRVYSLSRANSDGKTRRGSYQTGRILCQRINNGYKSLKLIKHGKEKRFVVHRLVAMAFLSNTENKLFINHKDFNRSNNHVSNLEWVTPQENTIHACENGNKNVMYEKDDKFNIGDIVEIKNLIRNKHWFIEDVAKLYKTSIEIIKLINN